jgi:hypothetical protein
MEATSAGNGKKMTANVPLDTPIVRGETQLDSLTLRRPGAGELRGLSLGRLMQMDVNEIVKLLPRITMPPITDVEAATLDGADMMEIGGELADFFLTKRRRDELQTT